MEGRTLAGVCLLAFGAASAAAGRVAGSFLPTSFGLAVAVVGAMALQVGGGTTGGDVYPALIGESVRSAGALLEGSALSGRATFMNTADGELRAFVPASGLGGLEEYRGQTGLMLVPPGAQLVVLAGVQEGSGFEEALEGVLTDSHLASSVLAVEAGAGTFRARIRGLAPLEESKAVNDSLGSPFACIAACVAARVKGQPVRIVEEASRPSEITVSVEVVQSDGGP